MIKPTRRIINNTNHSLSVLDGRTSKSSSNAKSPSSHLPSSSPLLIRERSKTTTPDKHQKRKQPTVQLSRYPPRKLPEGFVQLAYDCIEIILNYVGTIEIEPKLANKHIWNDSFINWARFARDWFGRCYLDGRSRFLFKLGIVKDCKNKYNLEHVKILCGISKRLNSPMVSYWEIQVMEQVTRINSKLLTRDENSYLIQLHKRTTTLCKTKENVSLFSSIKYVKIPKGIKLLPPLLNLFPNMENIRLRHDYGWNQDWYAQLIKPIYFKSYICKKMEIFFPWEKEGSDLGCTLNFLEFFPNLQYLRIGSGLSMCNMELIQILKNLTVLIIGTIEDSSRFPLDETELCSIISQFPNLQILTIEKGSICGNALSELSKSKSIERLNVSIYSCNDDIQYGFPSLKSFINGDDLVIPCPQLENLEVTLPKYEPLFDWSRWEDVGKLTNLKRITLNSVRLTDRITESWERIEMFVALLKLDKLETLTFNINKKDKGITIEIMKKLIEWSKLNKPNCVNVRFSKKDHQVSFNPQTMNDYTRLRVLS